MKMPFDNLQSVIHCPICDKKYRPMKMLILDEDDKRTTIHLTCSSCGVSSMIFVSLGQFGAVSLGLLTDLEQSEARSVFQRETISTDNVIEAHQFLKNYTGGVEGLFSNL
jgi:transcription elongation factor Elf1